MSGVLKLGSTTFGTENNGKIELTNVGPTQFSSSNHTWELKAVDAPIVGANYSTNDDPLSGQLAIYNGATKLWGITEGGLVQNPNVPYFFVNTFDGTTFNAGGFTGGSDQSTQGHYNPTNGRFTVPISGLYCVFAGVLANSGSGRVEGAIALNGVDIIYFNSNPIDSFDGPVGLCIKYANAGDYFDTNRKSGTAYAAVNLNHYFGGYLIG